MSKKTSSQVEVKQLDLQRIQVTIEGFTPVIVHKFSEKARKEMLAKSMGSALPKTKKDPQAEYEACFYYFDDGSYGLPVEYIKNSMIRGAKMLNIVMTDAKSAFFIVTEFSKREQKYLLRFKGSAPKMREDVVTVGNGGADLRYRPQFDEWEINLTIEYNQGMLTAEQVVNMLNCGGWGVGAGEWRPSSGKPGEFGRYKVKTEKSKSKK